MRVKTKKRVYTIKKKTKHTPKQLNRSVKTLVKQTKQTMKRASEPSKTHQNASGRLAEQEGPQYLLAQLEGANTAYEAQKGLVKGGIKTVANRISAARSFARAAKTRSAKTPGRFKKVVTSKPARTLGRGVKNSPQNVRKKLMSVASETASDSDVAQRMGTAAEIYMAKSILNVVTLALGKAVFVAKTVAAKVALFVLKKAAAALSAVTGVAMSTIAVVGAIIVAVVIAISMMLSARQAEAERQVRMMSPGGRAYQAVMDNYREHVNAFIAAESGKYDEVRLYGLKDNKLPLDSNFAGLAVQIYKYSGGLLDLRVIGDQILLPNRGEVFDMFAGLYDHFNPVETKIVDKEGKKILQVSCTTYAQDQITNDKISSYMKTKMPGVMDEPYSEAYFVINDFFKWIDGRGDISDQALEEYQLMLERQTTTVLSIGDAVYPFGQKRYIDDRFGWRMLNGKLNYHRGIDFPAAEGTPILSCTSGYAAKLYNDSMGNYVAVNTNIDGRDYRFVYAHMVSFSDFPAPGEIRAGTVIGYVGDTGYSFGNHLHLGVFVGGEAIDPLSLFPWLDN